MTASKLTYSMIITFVTIVNCISSENTSANEAKHSMSDIIQYKHANEIVRLPEEEIPFITGFVLNYFLLVISMISNRRWFVETILEHTSS